MAKFATGSVKPQKARNNYPCRFCDEQIAAGTIYALRTGISFGRRSSIYSRYHLGCWLEVEVAAFVDFEQLHQKMLRHEPGLRSTKLNKLTPEERKRVQTLQSYITKRDLPALQKAYEQKSTERVIKVMSTLANRWEEFAKFGITPKKYLWKNKQLDSYIATYDNNWMNLVFKDDLSVEEQVVALRRSMEDKYLPDWGNQ